jgi:hypothetical protein
MTHYQSSTSENRKKLLGHLRSLTDFPPLLSALYYLLNRKILSTSQRYAIVEGLYPLFRELVPKITPGKSKEISKLFLSHFILILVIISTLDFNRQSCV